MAIFCSLFQILDNLALTLVGEVNLVEWNVRKREARLLGLSHYPYSASRDDVGGEEIGTGSGYNCSCISHRKVQQNQAVSSWPKLPMRPYISVKFGR